MAKYHFSDHERYAVYTVHGEKCYICGRPLDLLSMEVDHIIPESLYDSSAELERVKARLGLPVTFELQSYENWMPSCGPCNRRKSDTVFSPSLELQGKLEDAARKARKAEALEDKMISDREVAKAWNKIKRAAANGKVHELVRAEIRTFAHFHQMQREPELAASSIRLAPIYRVLAERDNFRVVSGPYGVGGGPITPSPGSNFRCPNCGSTYWNGVRCITCGEMSDE